MNNERKLLHIVVIMSCIEKTCSFPNRVCDWLNKEQINVWIKRCPLRLKQQELQDKRTNQNTVFTLVQSQEKFNFPRSSSEHNDLFNFMKHLETFTRLAEIAKSKHLRENPQVKIAISCWGTKSSFFFAWTFKNMHTFKMSIERANLNLTYFISYQKLDSG